MSVTCSCPIVPVSEADFVAIDRQVMGCAFESQNEFGRHMEEQVYEGDLVYRMDRLGLEVCAQAKIEVVWRGFIATFYLDLVVNGVVYELKAVEAFNASHEAQAFQYAALMLLDRIKLINFGACQVQGRLCRCPFQQVSRFHGRVDTSKFLVMSDASRRFKDDATEMFRELGGFLNGSLYRDALSHSLPEEFSNARLPLSKQGRSLGSYRISLVDSDTAFAVTTLSKVNDYRKHLKRLIHLLPIKGVHWLNVDGCDLAIETVTG